MEAVTWLGLIERQCRYVRDVGRVHLADSGRVLSLSYVSPRLCHYALFSHSGHTSTILTSIVLNADVTRSSDVGVHCIGLSICRILQPGFCGVL